MDTRQPVTGNRKGQFLWMEVTARSNYIQNLKKKISDGYFFSDQVLAKIVDDLAPIIDDAIFTD